VEAAAVTSGDNRVEAQGDEAAEAPRGKEAV